MDNKRKRVLSSEESNTKSAKKEDVNELVHNRVLYTAATPQVANVLRFVIHQPKFYQWVTLLEAIGEIDFDQINITDVTMFTPTLLGFVKFEVKYQGGKPLDKKTGAPIPGNVVFLRGNAAAVLPIIKCEGSDDKLVILCEQIKLPACRSILEAPAGMADNVTGDLKGVMIKELKEETGIEATAENLISLGNMMPSAGGCDEVIDLFAIEKTCTLEEIAEMKVTIYGEENTDERIHLRFVEFDKFDDVLDEIGDPKAECIWRRYLRHLRK